MHSKIRIGLSVVIITILITMIAYSQFAPDPYILLATPLVSLVIAALLTHVLYDKMQILNASE
jgi:hypothetical protein